MTVRGKPTGRRPAPLTELQKKLGKKYVREEISAGKYSRAQAIAVGLSRARAAAPAGDRRGRSSR